ncbi:MAG TPA: hypothetical protein VE978_28110 [Chitinophagales bacterium]|nr:hypothetical protein [Chitinophagales bacterium]
MSKKILHHFISLSPKHPLPWQKDRSTLAKVDVKFDKDRSTLVKVDVTLENSRMTLMKVDVNFEKGDWLPLLVFAEEMQPSQTNSKCAGASVVGLPAHRSWQRPTTAKKLIF